jgi:hypothetical protein
MGFKDLLDIVTNPMASPAQKLEATNKIIWEYHLWPWLIRWLKYHDLLRTPVPHFPHPLPDPTPLSLEDLLPMMLAPFLGDPNPQPNIPPELRLQATTKFRDGIQGFVAELDKEVGALQKRVKVKS